MGAVDPGDPQLAGAVLAPHFGGRCTVGPTMIGAEEQQIAAA
ncbi:hypothetical protein ABH930_005117 [Kitasatospora sp. GAS204A]|nr:hypothetical protein [Kitasatospora sp. GAS204B]MDH6121019.1 hypothetical protein [Kitasatospora sp. GAS204B]